MKVRVDSITLTAKPVISENVPHTFGSDLLVEVVVSSVKFAFLIKSGFKCDGASVPKLFRWFLPSWAEDGCGFNADIYNVGAAIHDGLYINKGFGVFTREDCDSILRGIWRECGISRFRAGVADKCIEWFAGGKKHWGNDTYKVGNLFLMDY